MCKHTPGPWKAEETRDAGRGPKVTKIELAAVLASHAAWVRGEPGGHRANLTRANLTCANLTGANLTRANLTCANLTRANLTDAIMWIGNRRVVAN